MSIILPTHANTAPQVIEFEGAHNKRIMDYQVDLLDRYDNLKVENLKGVVPGGTLSWTAGASVKGGGSISLKDLGQDIDWLNDRFYVSALIEDDNNEIEQIGLGVFLPTAPKGEWRGSKQTRAIELHDKSSILDGDQPDHVYSLPKGTNIIDKVKDIIVSVGETSGSIETDTKELENDLVFDFDQTWLLIINKLLDYAGYFSLQCDGRGNFVTIKYKRPSDRSPVYATTSPFQDGPNSVLGPDWSHEEDIYSVPNRIIFPVQGDEDKAGFIIKAENNDPNSPFSFQNRGRWITEKMDAGESAEDTDTQNTDVTILKNKVENRLDVVTDVSAKYEISHLYMERAIINTALLFRAGDVDEVLATITSTEIVMDYNTLVTTTLKSASKINYDITVVTL